MLFREQEYERKYSCQYLELPRGKPGSMAGTAFLIKKEVKIGFPTVVGDNINIMKTTFECNIDLY